LLEFFAVDFVEIGCFVGVEQRPFAVSFNAFHAATNNASAHATTKEKQSKRRCKKKKTLTRNLESKGHKTEPSPSLPPSMILPEIQKLEHIRMPRLDVNSKSTRAFVPTLVNVAGGSAVCAEHGDDTVGVVVCACNVGAGGEEVKVSEGLMGRRDRAYPVARIQ